MAVMLVSPVAESILPLLVGVLCFSSQVVHTQQTILFVKTNSGSSCSDDVQISECRTLDWYSNNSNSSFTSNTEMLFQAGIHSLSIFIKVNNCHNFTMTGNGSALHNSDGQPQPTSIVYCTGSYNTMSGLYFSNSSNIHVHNLEFRFCSGLYTMKDSLHQFAGSLIFNSVKDISLDQVVVSNAIGYGLHTSNIFGTNRVLDSAFSHASKHPTINNSGNAHFYFDKHFSSSHTVLVVKLSWFTYGESEGAAGGLSVYIHCPSVHVAIVNITTKRNVGANGGNLALSLIHI